VKIEVEWSAGGVVIREHLGRWELAVIQPRGKNIFCLPKGHIDEGESPEGAALREVREETGLQARIRAPLGDIQYEYRFKGKRVRKRVSFFLLEYEAGTIDALEQRMRLEVNRAMWIPLHEGLSALAYAGEKDVLKRALELSGLKPVSPNDGP
jgi:8-oxo-dGTP pyrophosphatase MutT (NUDIX family)